MDNTAAKADWNVMYICEHHLESRDQWTPLIYNRDLDKSICPECNAQYTMFTGTQVLWSRELEQKALQYAQKLAGPNGDVIKEKTLESSFTHPTPLSEAPTRPEPPKNFEQHLHDFVVQWKQSNSKTDGHHHANASRILFDLYSEKASKGWDDYQIKQYFGIISFFNHEIENHKNR